MNSLSNEHNLALLRATEQLIEDDQSGLPIGRITAIVGAARDQILAGYEALGLDVEPPADFVRTVMELTRQDVHLMRVRAPGDDADFVATGA
jgi:hypothetical protein